MHDAAGSHGAVSVEPVPEDVGLRFVSDEEPGWRRRRCGKGFVYVDAAGKRVDDDRALERIRKLAIPPAYDDVWISPDARGHLQATGRDARGRKQYRYHAEWRAVRDEVKYDRLVPFGEALTPLRRRVDSDLRLAGMPSDKVLATVVGLLESTLIRIGNEEYARVNGSYGLTTLRSRHVRTNGSALELVFRGKGGKQHRVGVHDRRLARVVSKLGQLPGQRLFCYLDDEGEACPVESGDVNDYLRGIAGSAFTAKDFRTWTATLLATTVLADGDPPATPREARRDAAEAVQLVAQRLGNTGAVCRASYVHPDIFRLHSEGRLPALWESGPARDTRWMSAEERRLLHVLRRARRG
jgi:DNA topoisomerase-1